MSPKLRIPRTVFTHGRFTSRLLMLILVLYRQVVTVKNTINSVYVWKTLFAISSMKLEFVSVWTMSIPRSTTLRKMSAIPSLWSRPWTVLHGRVSVDKSCGNYFRNKTFRLILVGKSCENYFWIKTISEFKNFRLIFPFSFLCLESFWRSSNSLQRWNWVKTREECRAAFPLFRTNNESFTSNSKMASEKKMMLIYPITFQTR